MTIPAIKPNSKLLYKVNRSVETIKTNCSTPSLYTSLNTRGEASLMPAKTSTAARAARGIMFITGCKTTINIKTKKPEFSEWKWIEIPFSSFEKSDGRFSRFLPEEFDIETIKSIGIVAYGKDFYANIDVAGIELY